ncbi:MAG: SIR2 family protein, partial [Janthinobacterium sp.]
LIREIAVLQGVNEIREPDQWYRETFNLEPDYSEILEKLTSTPEERINLLRRYFEPTSDDLADGLKTPTKAHKSIAWLVKNGYIKVVITTNFDRLLENSLSDIGIQPTIISNPNHVDNVLPLVHSQATVIKINGDYLDTKFLNIKSELEKYDERIEGILGRVFEDFGLVTCGWSAKWDTALVNTIKSSNKFRFSSYFTHVSDPDDTMRDLAQSRHGKLVQIQNADTLFSKIVENIEALENSRSTHPLTGRIVIAQVKKFVATGEHLVKLHDLIHDVTENCVVRIKKGNKNITKQVINEYKEDLELLITVLLNTTYWAKNDHYAMIFKSLKRIYFTSDDSSTSGNYTRFPALVLRYVIGIACLARSNYQLLSQLCNLHVKFSVPILYPTLSLTELTNPWQLIDRSFFKDYYSKDFYCPHSKFIREYLRPFFLEILPENQEFKETFELYELITCMNHLENDTKYGFPAGAYLLDGDQYAKTQFKALLKDRESSILFSSGLFKQQENLEEKLDKHYQENVSRYA